MKRTTRRPEKGQVFLLVAIAAVGMLGFAGIAIDGGIVFTERRRAQNAADSAALAAALAKIDSANLFTAGFARAMDNGFSNSVPGNVVTITNPPLAGPYAGDNQYIQVEIQSQVQTVFAHFVYAGILENTVTATARARPARVYPFLTGEAIVGLAETGCAVVWSHGNADTFVSGGGVFVNSNDPNCAFRANGSNTFDVTGGGINVVGGWEIGNNATVSPIPTGGAAQIERPTILPPTCSGSGTRDSGTGVLTPGNIDDFRFNGGTWTLQEGIYCVTGDFDVNAGTVITGENVFIYMIDGDVTWNGGGELNLDAPDDGEYAGLLIYQDPSNTNRATINGNSNSHFTGTMFFPSAEVQINGTGASNGFHSQVIGDKVDMSGTAELDILYDPGENYQIREPAKVDLSE